MAYDAFISYSHAADGQLAPALQRGLQRLAKPWNRRRALDIFRDETGLSTNPHLWSSVQGALDGSMWFILLASPEAAASEWVKREIEHWLATKDAEHILPVLTDGTWTWDGATGDYSLDSTAVPNALRGTLRDEPRHLDLRWARTETDLDLRNGRFRDAVADLAAPLHGLPKDELEGEDIRQHRHARRLARAAMMSLAVLLVAALVSGGLAVLNGREADRAKGRAEREATVANARRLAAQAVAKARSAPDLALLLGVEARRLHESAETRSSLLTALQRTSRLERILTGFPRGEAASGLSQDGSIVALSNDAGQVRLLEVATRKQTQSFVTDQRGPLTVLFSSDGTTLATTSADTTVRLWDARTGRPSSAVLREHTRPVRAGAFSADGRLLATEDSGGFGVVWEVLSGRVAAKVPKIALSALEPGVSWSADGRRLAVGGSPVTVFEVPSMAKVFELPFDDQAPAPVALNPAGTLLAASKAKPSKVELWNLDTRQLRAGIVPPDSDAVNQLVFSRDGSRLAAGLSNGTTALWDVGSTSPVTEPFGAHTGPVTRISFGRDSSEIRTASYNSVAAWSVSVLGPLSSRAPFPGGPLSLQVSAAFSPDGRILARNDLSSRVQFNDARTGAPMGGPVVVGVTTSFNTTVAFTADGRTVVSGDGRGGLVLLDVASRTAVRPSLQLSDAGISGVAVSDGGLVAAGLGDGSVAIVDLRRWKLRWQSKAHSSELVWVDFSPNGRLLASAGADGKTVVHDTDREQRATVAARGVAALTVAFDPSGRYIAVGYDDAAVSLIDAKQGRVLGAPLLGHSRALGLEFSPDAKLLAVMGSNGRIALWDLAGRVRLGDDLAGELDQFGSGMTFSSDGKELVAADASAIFRWNLDPAAWTKRACELAARNLTHAEWREHIGDEPYRKTCPQWPAA